MQQLFSDWATTHQSIREDQVVEPPPEGLLSATEINREVAMTHPTLGTRTFAPESDFEALAKEGWVPDYDDSANFLESVHMQAYYFQVRFFPRFKWSLLRAPKDEFFVIADRAVAWAADGYVDAPPSCLRDPSAYVLAPLSRNLVLVGRHRTDQWQVTPAEVNAVIALWAHQWIAGPAQHVVEAALVARRWAVAE